MKIFFLFIVLLLPLLANAQDEEYPAHQSTTVPAQSRFEFIQSSLSAKGTYKIDKFKGNVYQLVKTSIGSSTWELIKKEGV